MTDVVSCPGCVGEVDRDLHLLCPTCHTDVTAARVPRPVATAVVCDAEAPAGQATWRCPSAGCEQASPLAATVDACPFCLEPRINVAPATGVEGRFELRDESGATVVVLAGPGPWRLGREEADSPQLAPRMTVSRSHVLVSRRGGGLAVRDLGSSNQTFVGQAALKAGEERLVEPGSTIGLGRTVALRVHCA